MTATGVIHFDTSVVYKKKVSVLLVLAICYVLLSWIWSWFSLVWPRERERGEREKEIETERMLVASLIVSNLYNMWARHEISNNEVYGTSKASDQPAHTHSLIRAFASRLNIS